MTPWGKLFVNSTGAGTGTNFSDIGINGTIADTISINNASASSQATGPTVFWALLAIVLNAMSQDSPTARHFFDAEAVEEGSLSLLLSSPVICLADIVIDLYCIFKLRKEAGRREEVKTTNRANSISVRIILVLFGVLP